MSYFPFLSEGVPQEYQYLGTALIRSIRYALQREGFGVVNTHESSLGDIYDRELVLTVGKKLNTDLLLCGRYSIEQGEINHVIRLFVLVYDIQGNERIIEKLFIGRTGTGIFVMIDEAAERIRKEVLSYFINREKILLQAKKIREREENLRREEREKNLIERLQLSALKTQMNDSPYLDTHVNDPKTIKIFTWFSYAYHQRSEYSVYSTAYGIPAATKNYSYQAVSNDLLISIGVVKNLVLGIEQGFYLYRGVTGLEGTSAADTRLNYKSLVFNPIFFLKWRFLQDENHGINLTLDFRFQPELSDTALSQSVFSAWTQSNSWYYTLALHFSKTIGRFTPFGSIIFSYNRVTTGEWRYHEDKQATSYIYGFEKSSDKNNFGLTLKIGTEYRIAKWFIMNFYVGFIFRLKSYNFIMNRDGWGSPQKYTTPINYLNSLFINTTFIFYLGQGYSIAVMPQFFYDKAYTAYMESLANPNYNMTINYKRKNIFRIYFYFTKIFDF